MRLYTDVLSALFYARDPVTVARDLLGKLLVRELDGQALVGRIVETEAYLATHDPANHAYRGWKPRHASMFGPPGHAYVYAMHRYHCLNIVTEAESVPSAVLLRAVEPLVGLEAMHARRPTRRQTNLTSGPGKLCQALAIDRTFDAWDVTQGQGLWLAMPATPALLDVAVTARIGVTAARHLPLRFYVVSSQYVSRGPRPVTPHAPYQAGPVPGQTTGP
jgi:DNA-3-methyladenine glycosylase